MNQLAALSATRQFTDTFTRTFPQISSSNRAALSLIKKTIREIVKQPQSIREQHIIFHAADYYQNTITGDNPEMVYDSQGQMLFGDFEGLVTYLNESCQKYEQYNTIKSDALAVINKFKTNNEQDKQQLNWDDNKTITQQLYNSSVNKIRDAFIQKGLRSNVEKLKALTDDAFEALCLKLCMLTLDQLCALLHVLEFEKYSGTYIGKNKKSTTTKVFENDNQMYEYLESIFEKYKASSFKSCFKSLKDNATENAVTKSKAWGYVEEMEIFYESLTK